MPSGENRAMFAVVLFTGMIIHGFFSEVLVRSPGLIPANVNFVKKVVFPLEILSVVAVGAALFHAIVSLGVLTAFVLMIQGSWNWTMILLPLVLIPLTVLSLGVSWLFSSLGVYLRDIGQSVGLLSTVLLFLSPVFYPAGSLPAAVRGWIILNPLTIVIEQTRGCVLWGTLPAAPALVGYSVASLIVAWSGYAWFQKTRGGFADVL